MTEKLDKAWVDMQKAIKATDRWLLSCLTYSFFHTIVCFIHAFSSSHSSEPLYTHFRYPLIFVMPLIRIIVHAAMSSERNSFF